MKHTKENSNRAFSLVELIIVIAIMAVLVGILAPQYLSYMHKAKVATDWANLRNYYTEITADYISTGEWNPDVLTVDQDPTNVDLWQQTEIHFLSGATVKMKDGYFAIRREHGENGYQISYYCNTCRTKEGYDKHKDTCILALK